MVEHDVGELIVTVHDPRLVVARTVASQPVTRFVQAGDLAKLEPSEMCLPAINLAIVESFRSAKSLQSSGLPVHPGQLCDGVD